MDGTEKVWLRFLVEGGVAGTVDIITRKPLDFKRPFSFEASAGAVYADLPSKADPQLSAIGEDILKAIVKAPDIRSAIVELATPS